MLELHMIPTSGDATLLRFVENGADVNILIDGGNRKDDCLGYLKSKGVNRVQLAIASHLDEDHIRGLRRVADEMPVEELWITDVSALVRPAAQLLYMAKCLYESMLVVDGRGLRDGNKLAVYDGFQQQLGPFFLEVLSPPKSLHDYLRRPKVIDEILRSRKGQAIRRYVQNAVDERLREEGARQEGERRDQVVSEVLDRFDVDVPQKAEIERLIEEGEVDWHEYDEFFESARSFFNDISIVVKITFDYGGIMQTFLFPGDLTNWSLILASHPHAIRECVTKVPHHGSKIRVDQREYLTYLYAEAMRSDFWRRLPHPWHHLWKEWYYILRRHGEPLFPWFPHVGPLVPWISRDLDSVELYQYLSPTHSLIYPLRSSFRLPLLGVRNAIKTNSHRTSCNYKEGTVSASRKRPKESCIDCYACQERNKSTIIKWGA